MKQLGIAAGVLFSLVSFAAEPPTKLKPWLNAKQEWQRDTEK
jgi:hypothetical protein